MRRIFRGTNGSGERVQGGIAPRCLFAAADVETARLYGDVVEEIGVRPEARILVEGTAEFAQVTGRRRGLMIRTMRRGENLLKAADEAVDAAQAAGYDAVEFLSMKDMGIAIIDETAFERDLAPTAAPRL